MDIWIWYFPAVGTESTRSSGVGSDGYSEERSWSEVLPAGNLELADLNSDGHLDFILVGSFDPVTRVRTSKTYLLWGTPEGTPDA